MTAINLPTVALLRRARARPFAAAGDAAGAASVAAGRFLAVGLLFAAVLIGAAIAIHDGRLHWLGLQWLALGLLSAAGAMVLCRSRVAGRLGPGFVEAVAATGALFQLSHLALCGVQMSAGSNVPRAALLACVAVMAAGVLLAWRTRRLAMGTLLLAAGFAVAAFACVWTHPSVKIDVLMFQSESAAALLAGENPYAVRYRDVYGADSSDFYGPGVSRGGWLTYSFPYLPASLLLVLPAHSAGDVRYAHAAAVTLAGLLIAAAGRNRTAALAGAVLLTSPRSLFVVQTGWTEPLLIFLAAATLFAATRFRGATWLAVGLWIATKQYMILVLPFLRMLASAMGSRRAWRQTILAAGLLAAGVTIPFAAAEPRGFFRSVVEWQFVQPFRYDALSFPAMLGQALPSADTAVLGHAALPLAAALFAAVLAWWKAPRTPGGLMAAAALVYALFFAFSKQAFCNYYLFVVGLCCCAAAGLNASGTGAEPQGIGRGRSARNIV